MKKKVRKKKSKSEKEEKEEFSEWMADRYDEELMFQIRHYKRTGKIVDTMRLAVKYAPND